MAAPSNQGEVKVYSDLSNEQLRNLLRRRNNGMRLLSLLFVIHWMHAMPNIEKSQRI